MKKKSPRVIFLIVPEKGGNLSFNLSVRTIRLLAFLALLLAASLTVFIVYYRNITLRFLALNSQVEKIARLEQDNQALQELRVSLGEIYERESKIRHLAKDYYQPAAIRAAPAPAGPGPGLVAEPEIDDFIKNVLKQKNLNYIKSRDAAARQKLIVAAIPNIIPVDGWITRSFFPGEGDTLDSHAGIDIAAAANTPVKATADGVVTASGWQSSLGNVVEINHSYGFKTVYGHNARLLVNRGDFVKRGSIIAFSGNTGRSSAPHLHYEVIKNGANQDPVLFILK